MVDAKVLKLFVWALLTSLDGVRDAITYFMARKPKPKMPFDLDEHAVYIVIRGVVAYAVLQSDFSLMMMLSFMLVFPFFHNGMYYVATNVLYRSEQKEQGRKLTDVYPLWYFDHSAKSTAITNIKAVDRIGMMAIGVMLFFHEYFKHA